MRRSVLWGISKVRMGLIPCVFLLSLNHHLRFQEENRTLQANYLGGTLLTIVPYPLPSKNLSNRDSKNPPATSGPPSMPSAGPASQPPPSPPPPLHVHPFTKPHGSNFDADYYAETHMWAYNCFLEYGRHIQGRTNTEDCLKRPSLLRTIARDS